MNQPKPNPLREELARSQRADPHPDAGMLTAFAEDTLLLRERAEILAHFSVCAECRELLSIAGAALPESVAEAAQTQPLARPLRLPLRSWLPWAVVAAAIVAISSTVLLHQPNRLPPERPSISESAKLAPPAPKENTPPLGAPNQEAQPSPAPTPKAKRAMPARTPEEQLPTVPSLVENSVVPPPAESSGAAPAREAGLAGQMGMGRAEDEAKAVQGKDQGQDQAQSQSNSLPTGNTPAARSERQGAGSPGVVGGLVGRSTGSMGSMRTFAGAAAMGATSHVLSLHAQWRINDLGQVERSFGNGAWQTVLSNKNSKMRVVSVLDGDVWVGGENLQLYHSTDNGTTWTTIKLPNKDGREHAITHISFQTAQAGAVNAEDGTSWTTTDGGSTWK